MPDVQEIIPPAVDVSGNLTIIAVPGTTVATTVTAVKAGTRITYGFTSNGWQPTSSTATTEDARLALAAVLNSLDRKTLGFTITYTESTTAGSTDVVLGDTSAPFVFYERRNLPNQTDVATGQKVIAHVVTLSDADRVPAESGKFTKTRIGVYSQPPREITLT